MSRSKLFVGVAVAAALTSLGPAALSAPVHPLAAGVMPVFAPAPGAPTSFADIVERVGPAVVSINVKTRVPARRVTGPISPFERLPDGRRLPDVEATASGSGFFVSPDGYVVTNNHVVENARDITVSLKDQRELKATVVGTDEATDLAVLKVEGRNFPFVTFSTQARPRVGDWVIAVGNPFGLGGSATAGIVSANGRDVGSTFVDFLQIDAAINRGNSGGPTFDAAGRVIGVNSMIFSPSGGSVGIGFAVPADVADSVVRELIRSGKVTRGYIGATIQTLTADIAESLGLSGRKGAIVADVTPGGPADRAGLQSGDVVVSINGRPVDNASQLTRQVALSHAGDALRLEVNRSGAPRTISVQSGTRPSERELSGAPERPAGAGDLRLGLSVHRLDEADRRRYNLPTSLQGVVVDEVEQGTDAARKGLRAGDVIVRVGERPIAGPADLSSAVDAARAAGRRTVLLFVNREGRTLAVAVQLTSEVR